ncbi:MAG: hypothetical protein ABR910_02745 [Acidobacteriaceae bacterium]|jgi:hypothetical protein
MSKITRIATPLMAVAMMTSVPFLALAQNSLTGSDNKANTVAVPDMRAQADGPQKQAYQDGVEAAKLDRLAKRPISYKTSHLYLHPPVKGDARDAYRTSFQAGYEAAVAQGAAS